MRAVNLLPPERRSGSLSRSPLAGLTRQPLLAGSVACTIAVVGALALVAHSAATTVTARQASMRQLDVRLAALSKKGPVMSSAQRQATASHLNAVTSVVSQRVSWDGFLWSLSRVVPEDVWLLNLSASATAASAAAAAPAESTAGAPTAFTLTGDTYSQPSVARLMRRLRLVPWLQDVNLVTSSKSQLADHVVYQFTVGANFVQLPEVGP